MGSLNVLPSIPKFQCGQCGTCCSHIKGFVSDDERKFIEEFGYGKLPLIQLTTVEEMTFPLWGFERKKFQSYGKELGIDPKISVSRAIFDLNSEQCIIVTYQMNAESCPFLSDKGKCTVYGKKRAYICNLFPFNKSPFLDIGESEKSALFGNCPAIKDIVDKLDYKNKDILVQQLYESFGDTFLAAIQHDFVTEWSNRQVLEMMKNGLIRPAMNYPHGFLKKRLQNAKTIDFFDFLWTSKFMEKESVERIIERFENYDDAREKVDFSSKDI